MLKTIVFLFAFATLITLNGCATAYTGPKPNLSKVGQDAQDENKKFELSESYGDFNLSALKMNKAWYSTESVEPIILEVSPSSKANLEKMRAFHYFSWGIVATMVFVDVVENRSWSEQKGRWFLVGGILASGVYINLVGTNIAEQYNKDLKSKFTPTLGVSLTF